MLTRRASAGSRSGIRRVLVRWAGALGVLALGVTRAAAAPDPAVLYLNFSDGTESLLKADNDNAAQNQTALGAVTPYPAFSWPGITDGSVSRRELVRSVTQQVNEAFLPYNIVLTTTRPAAPPYTMVMIGGTPTLFGFDAKIGGVALMDCENRQPSNVVFAFPTALRGSVHALWVTIAQEAAHAYGLEHSTDTADIMYPRIDPAQHQFLDRETPISGVRVCSRDTQNSHQRLLQVLGPWPGGDKPLEDGSRPDTAPPQVSIDEPGAGMVGDAFTVRATVSDEVGVDHVMVEAGGERLTATRPPYAWSMAGFKPGPLRVTVTGVDLSGNAASASVDLTVGPELGGCAFAGMRRGTTGGGPPWMLIFVAACTLGACSRRRGRL